jgi:hypothetical protein
MSAALRDKGFVGLSMLFYGFANTMHNVNRDMVHDLYTATYGQTTAASKALSVAKAIPVVSGQLLAFYVGWSVLGELVSGRGPDDSDGDDEEERWATWFLRKLIMGPMYGIPWMGALVESAMMGRPVSVRIAPGLSIVDRLGRAGLRALKNDDAGAKEAVELGKTIGISLGVPVRPVRAAEYLLGDGGEEDLEQADIPGMVEGVVYGPEGKRGATPLSPLTQ